MAPRMNDPRSSRGPVAGGALLALSLLAGAVVGVALGQPSLGLLGGLAAGVIACLIVWRRDRRS